VWWRGLCHAGVVGFLCLSATRRLCALNVVSQCGVSFVKRLDIVESVLKLGAAVCFGKKLIVQTCS